MIGDSRLAYASSQPCQVIPMSLASCFQASAWTERRGSPTPHRANPWALAPSHVCLAWLLFKISRGLVLVVALFAICSSSKPPSWVFSRPGHYLLLGTELVPESFMRARRTQYFLKPYCNKSSSVGQQQMMCLSVLKSDADDDAPLQTCFFGVFQRRL